MKHLVPTLAALALAGVASSPLSAASIKDEGAGLTLAVKGQLQTRLTLLPSGTLSDVTAGGYPAATGAGNVFWYQGGDPVRYAAGATSTSGAAGAAVPYYTNTNSPLILNSTTTTVAQYNALAASMWPAMPNLGAFMTAPTAAGWTSAPVFVRNGGAYDPIRGRAGEPEKARFSIRRARLAFEAKYGDGWFGNITIRGDNAERRSNGDNAAINLYYAYAGKEFKGTDVTHTVTFGLYKPTTWKSIFSSSSYMMADADPAAMLVDINRGGGVFYNLSGGMFNIGASFMNSTYDGAATGGSSNGVLAEDDKGYYANLRLEFSPSKAMKGKAQQSFIGAEGTHLNIGLDVIREWNKTVAYNATAAAYQFVPPYAINAAGTQYTQVTQTTLLTPPGMGSNPGAAYWPTNPYYGAWFDQDSTIWGPDMLFHWNALTMMGAYKYRITEWSTQTDASGAPIDPADLHSSVWTLGMGWAIPTQTSGVWEPTLRYSRMDMDTRRDEFSNYGANGPDAALAVPTPSPWASNRNDTTNSGDLFEMGVNWYINGKTSNKLNLTYSNWRAEEGVGRAQVFLVQHNLTF
ncbi:MAG: OprO/OprP family phosphate-selective porin [Planctomycetes bacterium]|nr:OprO/OprP family phosphate-selective porin [Planctomycetota bacterium]